MDAAYRLKPVGTGGEIEIKDGMVVGRNPECDLVLTNGHPSRKHARLNIKPDGLWIEDLGSANGTFVNGQQINQPTRVGSGDLVAFDVNEFEVLAPAVQESATVVRRGVDAPTVARPQAAAKPASDAPMPAADAPKPEAPKPEAPKPEAPKPEAPKPQAPKPEAPKPEAPKPEAPKPGAPKPEAPKPEPAKPAAAAKPAPAAAPGAQEKGTRKPGAWADPDFRENVAGTKLFKPEDLKKMLEEQNVPQVQATSDAPYLNVTSGSSAGKRFKLQSDEPTKQWEIGSDATRDIVLADPGVSAFHAKIVNEGNRWKLIDQLSANGTFVNGQKGNISYLSGGDRIRFGTIECSFQLPSGGTARSGGKRTQWIIGAVAFVVTAVLLYVVIGML